MWYTTYAARTGRQQKTMRAKTHKAPAARTTSNSRSIQTLNELTSMCFMYVGEQSVIIILGSPGLTSRKYVDWSQTPLSKCVSDGARHTGRSSEQYYYNHYVL
jgi:hypothetical protein